MTMNDIDAAIAAMHADLDALAAAMLEKGVVEPVAELDVLSGSRVCVWLKTHSKNGAQFSEPGYKYISGKSYADCMDKAKAAIAELPDPQDAANQRYLTGLAKVVDAGRRDGVPDEWITPVTDVVKAMTENLIEGPKK